MRSLNYRVQRYCFYAKIFLVTRELYSYLEEIMQISYKKLWKLLIDKDMLKKDLAAKARISSTSIAKLSKNENVNTEILRKICAALDCDISDIMEMIKE